MHIRAPSKLSLRGSRSSAANSDNRETMKTLKHNVTAAGVVIAGLGSAFAYAQSSPPVAAAGGVPNDGYIVLGNLSGDGSFSSGDQLCPPGASLNYQGGRVHGCSGNGGADVPTVTAQSVLDHKYGKGRTVIVGYAPSGNAYTTVFFRIVKP